MADHCSFCSSTAGPFSSVEGLFTVLMCADCQAARGHGSGPLSGDDPRGDARRPGPTPHLGVGAEGGRQSPGDRRYASTTRRRGAGGPHVPGAGTGLVGTPSRSRRGLGHRAPDSSQAPPLMWLWRHNGRCCVKATQVCFWPEPISRRSRARSKAVDCERPWLSALCRSPVAPVWPGPECWLGPGRLQVLWPIDRPDVPGGPVAAGRPKSCRASSAS